MSLARRHRDRMLGRQAAEVERPARRKGSPAASAYELMRARLGVDLKRLKEIQSVEKKIELKRELLPAYADWIAGVLEAAAEGMEGVQDDILVQVMIWRIDVGDFEGALPLAEYVLRWNLDLPPRFERTAGCLIAEEIAANALTQLAQDDDAEVDLEMLMRVEALTADEDMPDQARAKIFKAIGFVLMRRGEKLDNDADGPAGGKRAAFGYALTALRRALALHDACGVKKPIQQLERELKKLEKETNSSGG